MDQHTIRIMAPIPEPNPARVAQSRSLSWTLKDFTMPVFDSVNNVLLYPYINSLADSRPTLLIYHPDTDTWETDSMYQPDGREVRGNSFIFDPIHNVLLSIGGLKPPDGDIDPTVTHFFLYRYGNGNAESQPPAVLPPTPPAAPVTIMPSTLQATYLGITGEDRVGKINQASGNGKPDFHVSVSGLRGTPNTVTITSDTGGIWETPFNGANWIVATQYDGKGNGDLWFEPFASNKFHVKVRYTDSTTDEADASKQVLNPPA